MTPANRFDDILGAAEKTDEEQPKTSKTKKKPKKSRNTPDDLWAALEAPEREPSIRLNLDIPIGLNDAITDKARALRTSKAEVIRKLLEWAFEYKSE